VPRGGEDCGSREAESFEATSHDVAMCRISSGRFARW
jgi:hypothetical protein